MPTASSILIAKLILGCFVFYTNQQQSVYLGCYVDNRNGIRVMKNYQPGSSYTPSMCVQICKLQNFQFAGLQIRGECYCDNTYTDQGAAPESDCSLPCIADSSQICGGGNRNSVYSTGFVTATTTISSSTLSSGSTYVGCYIDNLYGVRVLTITAPGSNYIPLTCVPICKAQGLAYAALQARGECYCGNSYADQGVAPATDCNQPCNADASQICGGGNRNSVYSTGLVVITAYKYLGCFVDNQGGARVLKAYQGSNYTPQTCVPVCKSQGFQFAALQIRGECYCGNSYADQGEASANDCDLPCTADRSQICGGGNRNSVYSTRFQNI